MVPLKILLSFQLVKLHNAFITGLIENVALDSDRHVHVYTYAHMHPTTQGSLQGIHPWYSQLCHWIKLCFPMIPFKSRKIKISSR